MSGGKVYTDAGEESCSPPDTEPYTDDARLIVMNSDIGVAIATLSTMVRRLSADLALWIASRHPWGSFFLFLSKQRYAVIEIDLPVAYLCPLLPQRTAACVGLEMERLAAGSTGSKAARARAKVRI